MKTYGKMQICSPPFYQHKSKSAAGGRGAVRWSKNNYGNARQITNNEQNDRSNADAEWFWIENKQLGQLLLQFCLNGQLIIAIRSLIKQRCQQTTIFPAKFLIFFVYTYLSFESVQHCLLRTIENELLIAALMFYGLWEKKRSTSDGKTTNISKFLIHFLW